MGGLYSGIQEVAPPPHAPSPRVGKPWPPAPRGTLGAGLGLAASPYGIPRAPRPLALGWPLYWAATMVAH
jgi:hypothetical protein